MDRSFLKPLQIPAERVVRLPTAGDLLEQCRDIDEQIVAAGGLDLAILGLGMNGHLGFNEPPTADTSGTRKVELTTQTIEANAQYWGEVTQVPTQAVTMGLASLLSAKCVVLLVSGTAKRNILHEALEGPISSEVPASYLQTMDSVIVIADRLAWGDD
jgi:glucosamine-6-phosphate deaminase